MNTFYRDREALVTGGLGFIGSNLAIRLVELGARVTIVDSSEPGCGANSYNISSVAGRINVICRDIGDAGEFESHIRNAGVIFNLAGEVSHIHSMEFPERDLRLNTLAHLRFLQVCTRVAPGVRVVYASTRQVYGRAEPLPVDESRPALPIDFNGIHKYAAAAYHTMLSRIGALDAVVLRLTNVYGPRMALDVPCQGFLATFFRKLLRNEPIEIYGDGRQSRDPVYIDDVVDAFLIAGKIPCPPSRIYNVGGPVPLSVAEIARVLCEAGAAEPPVHRPFPESLRRIDIGSYFADCGLAKRELNWTPQVSFREGAVSSLNYFRAHLPHYVDPFKPFLCTLHQLEDAGEQVRMA